MARRVGYRIALSQVGPVNDPEFRAAGPAARAEVLRWVLVYGLEEKDRDLAAGLDRSGAPLTPVSEATRRHRESKMGPADPNAPALMPAYAVSRTRLLLTGEVSPRADGVTFFWEYDPFTGGSWGDVLRFHRRGVGRRKVKRDVIGLSPAALDRVRARVMMRWAVVKRNGMRTPLRALEPVRAAAVTPIPVRGRTDFERFTYGIGAGSGPERSRAALAVGGSTGFFQRRPGGGFTAYGGPGPRPGPRPFVPPRPPAPPAPPKPPAPAYRDTSLPQHREQLKFIREKHAEALAAVAAEAGTTAAALKAELDAGFKAAVDAGEFYLRVDSGLIPRILADGRFKTQFEVKDTRGSYDPSGRSKAEAALFGTPADTPDAKRPVYGYVSRPGFANVGTASETSLEIYGDAVVRLKPGVRRRATVTGGDSLAMHDMLAGSPATAADSTALPVSGRRFGPIYQKFLQGVSDPGEWLDVLGQRFGYLESQYHGGLKVEDVEEIAFPEPPPPDVARALEAKGIRWRVIRERE